MSETQKAPTLEQEFAVLERASELLSTEAAWTRHTHARNKKGGHVDYNSKKACSFCIEGAMLRAMHELDVPMLSFARPKELMALTLNTMHPGNTFPAYVSVHNDDPRTTFADVRQAFEVVREHYIQTTKPSV